MANIRNRADKIIEKLPVVENYVFNNSQNFYKNGGYQLTEDKLNGLFRKKDERNINKENVPIAIKNQYETCVKIPDFSLLHEYHQNGNCSKDYSNPDFFILEWAKEELAKQKKARREKKKKIKKRQKEKKQVNTIQIYRQQYNEFGEKIVEGKGEEIVGDYVPPPPPDEEDEENNNNNNENKNKSNENSNSFQNFSNNYSSNNNNSSNNNKSSNEDGPPPPPPKNNTSNTNSSKSIINTNSSSNNSNNNSSKESDGPPPPPPPPMDDMPPPPKSEGTGITFKKTEVKPKTMSLLDQIKSGDNKSGLKKASERTLPEKKPIESSGGGGLNVADILAKKFQKLNDSDDEDDDDEEEDDDWD